MIVTVDLQFIINDSNSGFTVLH